LPHPCPCRRLAADRIVTRPAHVDAEREMGAMREKIAADLIG